MPYLDKEEIKKILNLKSSDLIHPAVAERQLEVIRKGFNYLIQPENNALYIADEVGLGKTYIALGIASLLRHFSQQPETYQDVILAPKSNLQTKWAKEIRQFIRNNYCILDNRVKSVLGYPVGAIDIKNSLSPIVADVPGYHLYRNSSMSFGLHTLSHREVRETLLSRLSNETVREYIYEAESLKYFHAGHRGKMKRFFAYLLSIHSPTTECLIVDEGHNFKYGLGESDLDEVSDRNNVATRFFGLKRNADEDKAIFSDFPELRKLVVPKVEKLIVLSATPKTNSLMELKRQFDCFLPKHVLSEARTETEIEEKLNSFLIRGKMEYFLSGKAYTRNQCREEHRNGNVDKHTQNEGLKIKDNIQSLVMGTLQYNTIKHLNKKYNATFELGMLAGFETFKFDQQKKTKDDQEYEETRTRKIQSAQDEEVLSSIVNSYKDTFGSLPPHPKQDAMVEALFKLMQNGEKALVFVRRVSSAYELERRLLDRWEQDVIYPELEKWNTTELQSEELDSLLTAYSTSREERNLIERLDPIFTDLARKLFGSPAQYHLPHKSKQLLTEEDLKTALYYVFNKRKTLDKGLQFYDFIKKQLTLEKYKSEFLDCAYGLISDTHSQWISLIGGENEGQMEGEEDESYFFHSYFKIPSNKYFRKSRIYQTDWFDLNFYLLNKHFKIANIDIKDLTRDQIHSRTKDASDIREVQEIYLKYMTEDEYHDYDIDTELYPSVLVSKNTLITSLLSNVFESEFHEFLNYLISKRKRKAEIFQEIKTLTTIIKSTLRNGLGFLPLYLADKANGDFIENYIKLITTEESCFNLIVKEIRLIIHEYQLLQAVNFPDKDNQKDIETKLIFQSPVKGLSGIKKNKDKVATQFRMPGYPYVLVTTDIFREGEDLHTYCQNIYHYGIAWNCSDMEQRTGRIDRINSLSNRKMMKSQSNDFEDKIHVYYPYLEKTLEVNQVNKLFTSINQFNQTFDLTGSIEEDVIASVNAVIEQIPQAIDLPRKSKFDYDSFIGYFDNGSKLRLREMIGINQNEIDKCLLNIKEKIFESGTFYKSPEIFPEDYKIIGDYILPNREARRGPFRVLIKNDLIPGEFQIEISSYLFKASSKVQRAFRDNIINKDRHFDVIDIEDYHAIALNYSIRHLDLEKLVKDLVDLVNIADTWEESITKGQDTVIFG